MRIGFYGGSFDPFTNGHLNVISKASKLFDKVIVGIGINPNKTRRFDLQLMKKTIEQVLASQKLDNVTVVTDNHILADVALRHNSTCLIRGIRNVTDYDYEETMASVNEEISGLDTIYIRAGNLSNVSSSMVMELLEHGKDVSKYLPKEVFEIVKK